MVAALSRLGVDQILGQRADDAVAAGVELADLAAGACARFRSRRRPRR
jgi:hypothetical protein